MGAKGKNPAREHYQRLRLLSCEALWSDEVAAFDAAGAPERMDRVAVVRAVGVVFSESGTAEQKLQARQWLRQLLRDPQEKVRRYAMTALPKLGAAADEEAELLDLLETTSSDREKKALGETLEKIGGAATLARTKEGRLGPPGRTAQKVEANVVRSLDPGAVRMDGILRDAGGIRVHLRCRSGLERILEKELQEIGRRAAKFRLVHSAPGLVVIEPLDAFRLAEVFALRCFGTAGFLLGTTEAESDEADALAAVIASPAARRVLEAFTDGPIRYRLNFSTRGHQRGVVRAVTNRVFELCPELINDSRGAPWQVDIHQTGRRLSVELTPRLRPDPRFAYRRRDVPAASHPPLAASMARLAGKMEDEIVWDPFCGSGVELVECALRGDVRRVIGTDHSGGAIEIAGANFAAAMGNSIPATFACCDFRDHAGVEGLGAGAVSLVISNPPMGRRVPIADLEALIEDLFAAASEVLRPGGRLVFANPLPVKAEGGRLSLEFRQKVDLGGFHVHMERWARR